MASHLLDTNALLWYFARDRRLSKDVAALLEQGLDGFCVSVASIWEAEIKQALGKLNPPAELGKTVRQVGLAVLDITAPDAVAAARLPSVHRDPFDRMLIAQARERGLTLVTADRVLLGYHVPVLWAGI
jgi:PIN domain nuclease of toxin-antitoxin system